MHPHSITVPDLAKEARSFFERLTRNTGETVWVRKDGCPDWITEMVWEAHNRGEIFPDDYRYEFVVQSLNIIADSESDDLDDLSPLEADVYTHDRLKWLGSRLDRYGYVDEVLERYGGDAFRSVIDMIGAGQEEEKAEVYQSVLNFLRQRVKELEEEEESNANE